MSIFVFIAVVALLSLFVVRLYMNSNPKITETPEVKEQYKSNFLL